MEWTVERIAELERINYLAAQPAAKVTPGVELLMRDDVILTHNAALPLSDANYACLLRATPETAEALITEVGDYFKAKKISPLVWLSPACTPADLPRRLLARGFIQQADTEAWLIMDQLQKIKTHAPAPAIVVKRIILPEATLFAKTMAAAFDLPPEWVRPLAKTLEPSIGLAGVSHYLAFVKDQPAGTLTLKCYKDYAVLSQAGVAPEFRGGRAIHNLAMHAVWEAQRQGVNHLFLQTTLGAKFERLLRMHGFKLAFRRTGYLRKVAEAR